jgi:tetratricopeptide (TPR) repeat protein
MSELEESIYVQIQALCSRGENLVDVGEYEEALDVFWSAWDLLPEPKTAWDASTWILAAIGDVNFQQEDFEAGRDNLAMAMHCPDAIGNPFLHLRLGQCQFELGNLDRAADELARALLIESPKLFESEDPKYLQFIKGRLKAPPGGW